MRDDYDHRPDDEDLTDVEPEAEYIADRGAEHEPVTRFNRQRRSPWTPGGTMQPAEGCNAAELARLL